MELRADQGQEDLCQEGPTGWSYMQVREVDTRTDKRGIQRWKIQDIQRRQGHKEQDGTRHQDRRREA